MRAGIDVDGVLADFIQGFNRLVKAETGIELSPAPTTWNYHLEAGVTREQNNKLWEYISTSLFWGTLHALPGAPEALERLNVLSKQGHDIYFITSRPGKLSKFLTEVWLRNHGMDNPTVLIASDKGPVAKGLKLHVFVDDKPENVADVAVASPSTRCYILNQPWNETYEFAHAYRWRVDSLGEVIKREFDSQKELAA